MYQYLVLISKSDFTLDQKFLVEHYNFRPTVKKMVYEIFNSAMLNQKMKMSLDVYKALSWLNGPANEIADSDAESLLLNDSFDKAMDDLTIYTANARSVIDQQAGQAKSKAELFAKLRQDKVIDEVINDSKLYEISNQIIPGQRRTNRNSMDTRDKLDPYRQIFLTLRFLLDKTNYQKYMNKRKKQVFNNPQMLNDLLKVMGRFSADGTYTDTIHNISWQLPLQVHHPVTLTSLFEDTYHVAAIKLAATVLHDYKVFLTNTLEDLFQHDSYEAIVILEVLRKHIQQGSNHIKIIQDYIFGQVDSRVPSLRDMEKLDVIDRNYIKETNDRVFQKMKEYEHIDLEDTKAFTNRDLEDIVTAVYDGTFKKSSAEI